MLDAIDWTLLRPDTWLSLIGWPVALAAGARLAQRARGPLREAAFVALGLLALRFVLLGNPVAWTAYAAWLDAEEVGWRQRDVIALRRDAFFEAPARPRYLAVGSSQTGALYTEYAERHADLGVFAVAGLGPLDLLLYREAIFARRPEVVLLYLSEFDLAREIAERAVVTSPAQGLALFELWARLRGLPGGRDHDAVMAELLAGEVLPELKYGFVLRGLADNLMRRAAGAAAAPARGSGAVSTLAERIALLRGEIRGEPVELNLALVAEFAAWLAEREIELVIVEGQIHPAVSDARIAPIAASVSAGLARLASERPRVLFVPRSQGFCFAAADFADASHVRREAGYAFTRRLIAWLDRERAAGGPLPAPGPTTAECAGL